MYNSEPEERKSAFSLSLFSFPYHVAATLLTTMTNAARWKLIAWGLFLSAWLVQTIATHLPPRYIDSADLARIHASDKTIHYYVFGVLGFLLAWALWTGMKDAWRSGCLAVVLGVIWSGIDEWTQQFVYRHTDWLDFLCDSCGILSGVALFHILRILVFAWTSRIRV